MVTMPLSSPWSPSSPQCNTDAVLHLALSRTYLLPPSQTRDHQMLFQVQSNLSLLMLPIFIERINVCEKKKVSSHCCCN